MIKSKIKKSVWLKMLWLLFISPFLCMAIIKITMICMKDGISFILFLTEFLLIFFLYIFLFLAGEAKYIVIDKEKGTLKYWSVFRLFGKTLYLDNFVSKIKVTEYPVGEPYDSIHLVNRENYTAFKITGLYYKNLEELDISIEKPYVHNYRFGFWLYLKLLFTRKMKVEKMNNRRSKKK